MPHKRAKRSVRVAQRSGSNIDIAPSKTHDHDALSSEPLPKSFSRVINAAAVRTEYRAKRKLQEDPTTSVDGQKAKRRKTEKSAGEEDVKGTRIRPGESLAHFNKRIEGDMRPVVRSAIQSSRATIRAQKKQTKPVDDGKAARKGKADDDDDDYDARKKSTAKSIPTHPPTTDKPKEFQRTSSATPRRLNDIAQAPPDLSALVRKAQQKPSGAKVGVAKEKAKQVLSPAQQLQLAQAREDAIRRYRELKAARSGP
ncbi:hypothetical protein C8F01DRAFT_330011 [Mycena amicta]|nr:hypothetical protein C8F01DRAFT_330011 [Mycena amicta]